MASFTQPCRLFLARLLLRVLSLVYRIAFLADMNPGCTADVLIWQARERVWRYIRNSCRSFTNMDINAQFSVIFQLAVFGEKNKYEKLLFVSRYHFRRFCQIEVRGVNEFLVNYVTLANVVSSGYTNMD